MIPLRTKILRLLFWACCSATTAIPFFYAIYGVFGHELSLTASIIGFFAFLGLCLSCCSLVDDQPELARRGMTWLGVFLLLILFSGALLGPITN
jgi:hypothetical protein